FVSQLATRVLEISREGIRDFRGTYEEYVHTCGDDHLDADAVVLKARREEKSASSGRRGGDRGQEANGGARRGGAAAARGPTRVELERSLEAVTARIEEA